MDLCSWFIQRLVFRSKEHFSSPGSVITVEIIRLLTQTMFVIKLLSMLETELQISATGHDHITLRRINIKTCYKHHVKIFQVSPTSR